MKARGWLLAAVAALAARPLAAYPDRVDCSRSITSGNMMGQAISPNGAPAQIQLAKGGITIPCGGALMAGDTGLTLVKGSTGSQYLIEAEMSAGSGSWGIISGSCSMQRAANRCCTMHGRVRAIGEPSVRVRAFACATGMHARITQSHMEMQITDSYCAVGLLRLTHGAVSCEQRLQYLLCATVGNCHNADSACQ